MAPALRAGLRHAAGATRATATEEAEHPRHAGPLQTITDPSSAATKTTRAMRVPGGLIINTCTRGAAYAAEALVMLPGADLLKTTEGWAIVEKARSL